jgi:hypothetical protein
MAAQRPAHSPLSTPSLSPSEAEEASRIKKATCMYDDDVGGTRREVCGSRLRYLHVLSIF